MEFKMDNVQCEIFFNNLDNIYFGGQTIRGNVIIKLSHEISLRGIYMKFHGKSHCSWSDGGSENRRRYSGEQFHLKETKYLTGSHQNGSKIYSPGEHKYSFELKLPIDLPQSMEFPNGFIKYYVVVCLDRPMFLEDKFMKPFTINKILDLNKIEELKNPVVKEIRTTFARIPFLFGYFQSAPLIITGSLVAGGICAGEIIHLDLNIQNESNQDVERFTIKLLQIMSYHPYRQAPSIVLEDVNNLVELSVKGCSKRKLNEKQVISICIPATAIPTDTSSRVCKLEYKLEISGWIAGFHLNPILDIPVTIGSVPLDGSISDSLPTVINNHNISSHL